MRAPGKTSVRRVAFTLALATLLLATPAALGQAVETHLGFGRVFGIGWNHDGTRYAVSHARFVEIVDPATDETVLRLPRHEDRAHCVAFSPTGDRIATCTWYGTVRVFDAGNGTVLLTIPGWQWTRSVRFSSDGERLLVGGQAAQKYEAHAVLYDARTGRRLVTYAAGAGVEHAELSPDDRRVLTCGRGDRVLLFDADTGELLSELATGQSAKATRILAFSPDSRRAIIALGTNEASVYDLATSEAVLTLTGHTEAIHCVDWSRDGTQIATGAGDGTVRLWNPNTGAEVGRLTGFLGKVTEVAFSPDGTRMLTASDEAAGLGVFRIATGERLGGRAGLAHWVVRRAVWSPDETAVLTLGWGDARVWDVATARSTMALPLEAEFGVAGAWMEGRPWLVSTDEAGAAGLWDVATGERLGTFKGHVAGLSDAAFSADGSKMFTSAFDGTAVRWNVETGERELTYIGHTDGVRAIALSPDGSTLATASMDTTVRLWDAATGAVLHELTAPWDDVNCVAFSPDGRKVIAGSDDKVARIWNVQSGKKLHSLAHGEVVMSARFSADGKFVVTAGGYPYLVDPTPPALVKVWNASGGWRVGGFPANFLSVRDVSFNAAGNRLLTAGSSGTVFVLDWTHDTPHSVYGLVSTPKPVAPGVEVRWSHEILAVGGDPVQVNWGFGDGASGQGESVLHTYERDGVYRASVTIESGLITTMDHRKIVVGDPLLTEPDLVLRLDFKRANRDRLKLRMEGPFELPVGWTPEGAEIEVNVAAAVRKDVAHRGFRVTLNRKGKGKSAGAKVKLRRVPGSDRWRLRLSLARQDFGLSGTPEDPSSWNDSLEGERAPVTVCVKIDGQVVWQASDDHRYKAKEGKVGRLRR